MQKSGKKVTHKISGIKISCIFWIIQWCTCSWSAIAQTYQPGSTYFGSDNYIEYMAGNTPIILSVPHGGDIEPLNFPDRNCIGCSYLKDSYTQELAREIQSKFQQQTGCYPHVVINLLHRKKLDMNRDLPEATDSNSTLDVYWYDYHNFIDSAKSSILTHFGKGIFLDLHGHGHTIQRIEVGYLVSKTNLQLPDSNLLLPPYSNATSIRNLSVNNLQNYTHPELLRGPYSLGTLYANMGFPSVPSQQDPFPLPADDYFNGGYNTFRHGSTTSGTIDAIQLELYSAIRFNTQQRSQFADSTVQLILHYLEEHYFQNYSVQPCQLTALENPVLPPSESFSIHSDQNLLTLFSPQIGEGYTMDIFSSIGQKVLTATIFKTPQQIDISNFPAGVYILRTGKINSAKRFIKY